MLKRTVAIVFILLSLANLAVFFFRDHFQYRPYADYRELYDICTPECSGKWSRFIHDYPDAEFRQSRTITDSILKDSLSGYDKVFRLGSFLYSRFSGQMGKPSKQLLNASPLQQYNTLLSSDSVELWCGNLASIFSYFCWTQDIASRNIEIMSPGGNHVLNECYIPELGRWILVDLTHNVIAARNRNGAFLDLQAVKDSLSRNVPLVMYQASADTIQKDTVPAVQYPGSAYYKKELENYYYHRINNDKIYTLPNKIKRYFFADTWYDIFEKDNKGNSAFRLKQLLFLLWIISFFVFLISRTKFRI